MRRFGRKAKTGAEKEKAEGKLENEDLKTPADDTPDQSAEEEAAAQDLVVKAMFHAAMREEIDDLKALIAAGADVEAPNPVGFKVSSPEL